VNEILALAHLIGAFLFLGGALFRRLIWNTVSTDTGDLLTPAVERRITWLMISGAAIFLFATLAGTRAGWISILSAALAPVFVAGFLAFEARKSPVLGYLAAFAGLIIIGSLAAASHAAAEPGLLPIASNIVHWVAIVTWGGCLVHLTLLPWPAINSACEQGRTNIGNLVRRYADLAIVALGVVLLSGGLLAFIHVHNSDAMNTTYYGRLVTLKGAMVAVMLITVTINLLKLAPACQSRARSGDGKELRGLLRRFRVLVIVETILLAGLLAASAGLEARNPPGVAPFNNPQSWQMTAGEVPLILALQPVAGSSTRARIEITAASSAYLFPEGALAFFDIYTPQRDAGGHDIEAVPIGPSGFLGEAVLAMPGEWRIDLRLSYPDGTSLAGESVVVLPALPLEEDLRPFLSLSAILYSSPGLITFIIGLLLLVSAGWLLRQSWLGNAPSWLMPVSMANMIMGAYLALSVAFVKTYPTTFRSNPQPYEAEVIRQGEIIYRAECAECHGLLGKGDSPWAKEERGGSIPDLAAPHMDVHTDGEIFWWLTKGIPSLDKPALIEELSESERWTVINYTRSLRHGMPAQ
jgi:putative copper export protein/mono/diheme cytochrome c family protein